LAIIPELPITALSKEMRAFTVDNVIEKMAKVMSGLETDVNGTLTDWEGKQTLR